MQIQKYLMQNIHGYFDKKENQISDPNLSWQFIE